MEKAVKSYEKHEKDADRFIALIDKYENFDKLTMAILNEFSEKMCIRDRWKPTRIEMAADWYLVGIRTDDLQGLRVRM